MAEGTQKDGVGNNSGSVLLKGDTQNSSGFSVSNFRQPDKEGAVLFQLIYCY